MLFLFQEHGEGHAAAGHEGGAHHEGAPHSLFTAIWERVKDTSLGKLYHFDDPELGQFWFDAIGFSIIAAVLLIVFASMATKFYNKVPRGLQNLFEWIVSLLRGLVQGFIPGKQADQYVPYLGSLFLYIFAMNMMGIVPAFRSPTMTLSTTAALGITTFVMVQQYAIRAGGIVSYIKHFMGEVLWLAPLMLVVEIIGELAKPLSLSLRLYGNIFGEDKVGEELMALGGGWVPVQAPMLFLAIFTSFLQAFIFTTLSTIYIASKVVHEGGHGDDHGHSEAHGEDHGHAQDDKHAQGAHP
ncbi:MAG TPA: F0F1 ATP synthase subunit A [Planctomycetota bacterium]|nr:F0F1 ATP synthase subunit A [Planctomycetota bacterium]